jgi:serine/threonine protein phosphatase PrpC
MDGRYRVEALLAGDDQQSAYRVTDLRGYERCWACGTAHGAGAAGERFCRDCGADMLARDLIMHERWLGDAETSAGIAIGGLEAETGGPRVFIQGERAYRVEPREVRPAAFPLGARLVAGAATDVGRMRAGEQNEDSALALVLDRLHDNQTVPFGVFAVADGLGGHANGQRASRLAVSVLAHTILRQLALPLLGAPADAPVDDDTLVSLLREAVQAANRSLCASNQEAGIDAGSTLVAILIQGAVAHIANVGDSRAYVCDEQGLRRITSDHSLVEQLVAGGMIGPDDVYTHPQRNQIFRSLGDDPDVTVDIFTQELRPGMRLLLCSDGLWEMARDPRIEQLLRSAPDPQAACDALVVAANEGGGEDNVTAVVVEAR